jgi:hypothetical protein
VSDDDKWLRANVLILYACLALLCAMLIYVGLR